jgi:chromosomal replication initiation ATPase DnaA
MARLRERDGDGELLSLVKRIAAAHHVTVVELLGTSRDPGASHARQALWSRLYELGHWSYPRLGKVFGRVHRTIMFGVAAHRERMGFPKPVQKPGRGFLMPVEQELP